MIYNIVVVSEIKCSKCLVIKSLNYFGRENRYLYGLRKQCKPCLSGKTRLWRRSHPNYVKEQQKAKYIKLGGSWSSQKVRDLILSYKVKPCMDCGNTYPPYVMDFDHRDPLQKKFSIAHAVTSYGYDNICKELEKCDLVCANCHRIRTHGKSK